MISVAEYMNRLAEQGVASPNRYQAVFTMPSGIQESAAQFSDLNEDSLSGNIWAKNTELNSGPALSMKCSQMQFPSRSLMTVENRHYNTPYKLPYASVYDEVQFTFVASEDLRERKFFEIWQEAVVNVATGSMNFYDEYKSTCYLMQLDKENNFKYGVWLDECYPLNIGAVDYSYATTNEVVNVTVTLAYRSWKNMTFMNRSLTR